ncbi:hypothetical protein DPEC_G00099170 [Dallia pectoralis]|uniref:Uncharacterized protein n=1 Tax=Dallia pectoralis TaxID=75939 RepID=A0ACC2GVW0_DALPE|nr:hypothetical protein DPEC_G00099170 [Dallia pectoralis]
MSEVIYADVVFTSHSSRDAGQNFSKECPPSSGDPSAPVGSKVRVALVSLVCLCVLLLVLTFTLGVLLRTELQHCQKNLTEVNDLLTTIKITQCDSNWEFYSGSCYFFSENELTWEQSQYACIREGGHLVIIDSQQEQDFIKQKVGNNKDINRYWIGLTDKEKEGAWLWVDNTPLDQSIRYWDLNNGTYASAWPEPNDWPPGEDCAQIVTTFLFRLHFGRVLEAPIMSDEIVYSNEQVICNQNKVAETRADVFKGASKGRSVRVTTVTLMFLWILLSFIATAWVVLYVSSRTTDNLSECTTGWKVYDGSCYYFSDEKMTWEQSQYACIREGGHLVIIESQQEQDFIRKQVGNPAIENCYWIGMTDMMVEGVWVWMDNTTLNDNTKYWDQHTGTDRSDKPEPNNGNLQEHCARMGRTCLNQMQCWFDYTCDKSDDPQWLEVLRQDESQPTTAAAAWRKDAVTKSAQMRRTQRMTMHEKLAIEFHEHKLKYLKDEHEMKMKILHVELAIKEEERNM